MVARAGGSQVCFMVVPDRTDMCTLGMWSTLLLAATWVEGTTAVYPGGEAGALFGTVISATIER